MTYESHTVRSLRRDPMPDEEIRLVLTLADDETESVVNETDAEAPDQPPAEAADQPTGGADDASSAPPVGESVAEAVESLGGEVVRELEFDRLLVEVEQTDIDSVVALSGVSSVETDAVLGPT